MANTRHPIGDSPIDFRINLMRLRLFMIHVSRETYFYIQNNFLNYEDYHLTWRKLSIHNDHQQRVEVIVQLQKKF